VVLTLCLSELLWCGTVLLLLRRDGLAFHFDWYGLGKLLLLGSLLLLLLGGVVPLWPAGIASQLLLCAAGMLLFLAAATRLKPLNGGERDILGKLLPARFLLW
jgi:CHASE2 domain-containing sensor protein